MKKIITIFAVSALFLVACTSDLEDSSPDLNTVKEQLDADTAVQAVQSRNIELCAAVESPERKEDCQTKVQDHIVLDEAVGSGDLDVCSEIQEDSTKEKCKVLIKADIERQQEIDEINETYEEVADAVEEGDISKCASFEDDVMKGQCQTNIYLDQAKEQGDSSICNKIANEEIAAVCKSSSEN